MLTVISYGGGVQSTALLVLAAQGKLGLDVDAALFANVGDDSEHPATLRYVREIAGPFGKAHGIPVRELYATTKDGKPRTLMHLLQTENTPSIPVRLGADGIPANRSCTRRFKVAVVGKYLKEHGATAACKATVAIGISTDEYMRASTKRQQPYELPVFPLLDLGYSRADCVRIIKDAGLPIPPKSSCYFCPFKRTHQWEEMRRDEPELFDKAAALEDSINARRVLRGKDPVYLTRLGRPLREAISQAQDELPLDSPDMEMCDEGYCWT